MSEMESPEDRKVEPESVESPTKTRLKREALLCDPQLRRKLSVVENETEKGMKRRRIKGIMF